MSGPAGRSTSRRHAQDRDDLPAVGLRTPRGARAAGPGAGAARRRETFWLSPRCEDLDERHRPPRSASSTGSPRRSRRPPPPGPGVGGAARAATWPQLDRLVDACGDRGPPGADGPVARAAAAVDLAATGAAGSEAPDLDDFLDAIASRSGPLAERWWFERGSRRSSTAGRPGSRSASTSTVPRGPSDVLLGRWCAVLGVDPARLVDRDGALRTLARPRPGRGVAPGRRAGAARADEPPRLRPIGKMWLGQRHRRSVRRRPGCRSGCGPGARRRSAPSRCCVSAASGSPGTSRTCGPTTAPSTPGHRRTPRELVDAAVRALASIALERLDERQARPTSRRSRTCRSTDGSAIVWADDWVTTGRTSGTSGRTPGR